MSWVKAIWARNQAKKYTDNSIPNRAILYSASQVLTEAEKEVAMDNIRAIHTRAMPSVNQDYAAEVEIGANTLTVISELTGNISVTLGDGITGCDNIYELSVTQGGTAHTVTLPTVSWISGTPPTFTANTTTRISLFYVGSTVCGTWHSVEGATE